MSRHKNCNVTASRRITSRGIIQILNKIRSKHITTTHRRHSTRIIHKISRHRNTHPAHISSNHDIQGLQRSNHMPIVNLTTPTRTMAQVNILKLSRTIRHILIGRTGITMTTTIRRSLLRGNSITYTQRRTDVTKRLTRRIRNLNIITLPLSNLTTRINRQSNTITHITIRLNNHTIILKRSVTRKLMHHTHGTRQPVSLLLRMIIRPRTRSNLGSRTRRRMIRVQMTHYHTQYMLRQHNSSLLRDLITTLNRRHNINITTNGSPIRHQIMIHIIVTQIYKRPHLILRRLKSNRLILTKGLNAQRITRLQGMITSSYTRISLPLTNGLLRHRITNRRLNITNRIGRHLIHSKHTPNDQSKHTILLMKTRNTVITSLSSNTILRRSRLNTQRTHLSLNLCSLIRGLRKEITYPNNHIISRNKMKGTRLRHTTTLNRTTSLRVIIAISHNINSTHTRPQIYNSTIRQSTRTISRRTGHLQILTTRRRQTLPLRTSRNPNNIHSRQLIMTPQFQHNKTNRLRLANRKQLPLVQYTTNPHAKLQKHTQTPPDNHGLSGLAK